VLEARRARQGGSVLKTLLMVFFVCVAITCSGGIVVFLWLYSTVSEIQQSSSEPTERARKTAAMQLQSFKVFDFAPDAEVTFYEDGCVVRGMGRSQTLGTVPCEVSIEIYENAQKAIWTVDYIIIDGQTVFTRKKE
jgi:hypothetical protein